MTNENSAMNRLNAHWPVALATSFLVAGLVIGALCAPPPAIGQTAREIAPRGLHDVWEIFGHNAKVATRMVVGILSFGVQASAGLSWIGFDLGKLVAQAAVTIPGWTVIATLVPHGIIEMAAFILFGSIQFEVVRIAIRLFKSPNLSAREQVLPIIRRMAVAVVLLASAAFIEVFVSGQLGARLT
jgi:uncharacterized membrane protein SpoIIM required for sporulation